MSIFNIKVRKLEYFEKWLILGIMIGVAAGIGAIIFYYLIVYVQSLFLGGIVGMTVPTASGEGSSRFVQGNFLLVPVSIILGGLLSGFLVYKFAPEAEGHGTDAIINSFHNKNGEIRRRVPIVKAIASAITIGSGGSAGREGPTAQIASGIGSFLADLLKLTKKERRIAILVGAGAGIGTIFKAPIGGALLAVEVPYKRDFETSALFPAIVASAVGYSIFGSIVGFQPIFGYYLGVFNPLNLPLYAVLGIGTGIFAIIYVKFFYYIHDKFKSFKISNYYKPAIGAVVVGMLAILFPEIMSVGYGWVQLMVNGSISSFPTFGLPILLILIFLPFAKIVATAFSIGTGGSGGVFAPGIFVGASVGLLFGMLFHTIFPGLVTSVAPFVIVGMLALMGGAGKIPISVLLMITEMTGSLQLLPAAMIAVSMSYLISGQSTLYRSQVATREESPVHMNEYQKPILENVKLKDLQLNDISVDAGAPVSYAIKRMKELGISSMPVVDKTQRKKRVGMIALLNIHSIHSKKVRAVATWDIRMVKLDSSGRVALDVMSEMKTTWVAVENDNEYVGCITLKQIINGYKKQLEMHD